MGSDPIFLILIAGGLFLLAKAIREIHERLEGEEPGRTARGRPSLAGVVLQIMFAMGFSVFVEMINLRVRGKTAPVSRGDFDRHPGGGRGVRGRGRAGRDGSRAAVAGLPRRTRGRRALPASAGPDRVRRHDPVHPARPRVLRLRNLAAPPGRHAGQLHHDLRRLREGRGGPPVRGRGDDPPRSPSRTRSDTCSCRQATRSPGSRRDTRTRSRGRGGPPRRRPNTTDETPGRRSGRG
jgi:hypothetical protein